MDFKNMKRILLVATLMATPLVSAAQDVWKCEQNGSISYTNVKKDTAGLKCTQMVSLDDGQVSKSAKNTVPTVKITPEIQKNRDVQRKKLLEHELLLEEQELARLSGTEENKEQRERHARNIADLKNELAK